MEFKIISKIYLTGILILIGGIIINFIAKKLSMGTWPELVIKIALNGFSNAIASQGAISIIFLFLIYPFLLGFFAFIVLKYLYE